LSALPITIKDKVKTASDPRHKKRIRAFKSVYAHSFSSQEITSKTAKKVIEKQAEIDEIITKCAPEWPINQINRTDVSVLRLAIFELLYKKKTPTKVIIDEAVEIAKRYGSHTSGSFVNGALAGALSLTRPEDV
jgi:transcription antitermination factor NusB